jgi:hypothetical protein
MQVFSEKIFCSKFASTTVIFLKFNKLVVQFQHFLKNVTCSVISTIFQKCNLCNFKNFSKISVGSKRVRKMATLNTVSEFSDWPISNGPEG